MTFPTIGDLRQSFMNIQNSNRLKSELNTLVQELTSGVKSDLTEALGLDQTRLSGIDRQLSILDRLMQANKSTDQLLTTMQTALSGIDSQRDMASQTLLTIQASSSNAQVRSAATLAEQSFEATVQLLNTRYGDRSLFGGRETRNSPLQDASFILDELRTATAGMTSAADVSNAIDLWFDAPAGGFETMAYQGDASGYLERDVDEQTSIRIEARADDQTVRDLLKSFSKAALAADASLGLSANDRRTLQQDAGVDLLTSASSMADIQARLGYLEGQAAEAATRLSAQSTALGISRNDLVQADPFETATRLEAVQLQLETQYTITARLSRLSLMEYLR